MTTPATFDLSIYQGDSYDLFFRVKARNGIGDLVYQDLTGATAKAQIRATKETASVLAEFTCSLSNQTSTPGGVLCRLTPATTAAITATAGVWDCEILYANGDKKTVLAGNVTFTKEVTRV